MCRTHLDSVRDCTAAESKVDCNRRSAGVCRGIGYRIRSVNRYYLYYDRFETGTPETETDGRRPCPGVRRGTLRTDRALGPPRLGVDGVSRPVAAEDPGHVGRDRPVQFRPGTLGVPPRVWGRDDRLELGER